MIGWFQVVASHVQTSSPTSAAEIDAPAATAAAGRRLARGSGCLLGSWRQRAAPHRPEKSP